MGEVSRLIAAKSVPSLLELPRDPRQRMGSHSREAGQAIVQFVAQDGAV